MCAVCGVCGACVCGMHSVCGRTRVTGLQALPCPAGVRPPSLFTSLAVAWDKPRPLLPRLQFWALRELAPAHIRPYMAVSMDPNRLEATDSPRDILPLEMNPVSPRGVPVSPFPMEGVPGVPGPTCSTHQTSVLGFFHPFPSFPL